MTLAANWSEVLKSDLDKLTQLTSSHRKTEVTKLKEGERRTVTILFLDIQGFTAMSEKLDPEDVQLIIDNCFKILTSEVEKFQGYVDKYEGDRMMALFGSRCATEEDCERALRAALGMREKFNEVNQILAQRDISIGIRVGVNSGLVVTGRIGKGRDQDFTVMGDAVNLASRLETNAPAGEILVNEEVKKVTGDIFLFKSLGEIQVKGKTQPFPVYTVKGLNPNRSERWERSPFTQRSAYVPRQMERKLLEESEAELKSAGRGIRVVAFSAPAGLGKSRLIHEFLRGVRQQKTNNSPVFRVAAVVEHTQPLAIFADLARKMIAHPNSHEMFSGSGERAVDAQRDFRATVEFLAGMAKPDDRLRSLEPQALQLEIHLAIRKILETIAAYAKRKGASPFYVHLEDLQWLDTASLECLEFLGANLDRSAPILFLWTYRPEFVPTEALRKSFQLKEISLSPLSENACGEILTNVLGELSLSENDREVLVRRSGGNPFFMEELIQALVDDGTLRREGETWVATRTIDEMSLPDSINRILLGRFDNLDADHKELLTAAAVIGETIPLQIILRVGEKLGLMQSEIEARLYNLSEQGFVVSRREEGPYGKQYAFRHSLTRDVVYSTLLNHNKKILHQMAGKGWEDLLQDRAPDQALLLYRHFLDAGASMECVKYGRLAVDQAMRQYAPKEGLRIISELKSVVSQSGVPPQEVLETNIRLLDSECRFYDFIGNRAEQLRCIRDLEAIQTDHSEVKLDARLSVLRASYFVAIGDFRTAREHAKTGLDCMGEKGQFSKLRMDILRTLGIACYSMGEYEDARKFYEKGQELARELKDRSAEASFLNTIGLVHFNLGKPAEALTYHTRAHEIMTEIGDRRGDANALGNQGLIYWTLGEYSRALQQMTASHSIFTEIGFRKGQAVTLGNIGVFFLKLGCYDDALQSCEQALALRREIKDRGGEGYDITNIGAVHMFLGNYDKAVEYFETGEKLAREIGMSYLLCENLNCSGIMHRKLGEIDPKSFEVALSKAEEALKVATEHNLIPAQVKALSNLARTLLLLGRKKEAYERSCRAMEMMKSQAGGIEGSEEDAHINHYHICNALERAEEANETLRVLVELIDRRASRIREEKYRKSFLESVRQNRYALAEWTKFKK